MVKQKTTFRMIRVLAAMVFVGATIPLAMAGAEEDFKEGMISYQRADFANGIPLLRKSADAGHAQAQAVLASILDAADSDEEAVIYYRKSASLGNLDGVFGLGTKIAVGEGVKKDEKEGLALIQRAAEAGHKDAIGAMAQAYIYGELGISVEQRKSGDASKWITQAADLGFIVALEAMEKAYRSGDFGFAADVSKADAVKKKLLTIKGVSEKKGRRRGDKQ